MPLPLLIASACLWIILILGVMALCVSLRAIDEQIARKKKPPRAIL